MIQENMQEEPLCCEAGGEMERMLYTGIKPVVPTFNDKW